jgi:MFS transporter, ACS family, tartrate transporter
MSIQENLSPQADPVLSPLEDARLESVVLWKVSLRLLPFIFILYVLNILDRINVGFAKLQMLGDLKMDNEVYAMGAGIFFLGYFIFEVPSNLMLKRVGARRWIARILISWGVISASMMFIVDPWSFYLLRFLLGLAEAGFFPGIILYLSYWFPARHRARAVARFMIGSAVTGIIGNPLSGFILQYSDKIGGLAGWQWLFLLEGLPSALCGFIALYYLTDRPALARWLKPEERNWLIDRMGREEQYRVERHGATLLQSMANPRVWLLCALYFTVSMGANSYGLYLPTILDIHFRGVSPMGTASAVGLASNPETGWLVGGLTKTMIEAGYSKFEIGLLAAIPSIVAMFAMVLVAMHSDHTGERRWHVALSAFVAAAGWAVVSQTQQPWVALGGLMLAHVGMMCMLAPFWSLPTAFLSGTAAAGGIAMINSIGNLGGFVGPFVIGKIEKATNSLAWGLLILAGALVFGGILAILARHDSTLERAQTTTPPGNDEVFPHGKFGQEFQRDKTNVDQRTTPGPVPPDAPHSSV